MAARLGRGQPNRPIIVRNSQLGGAPPPAPVVQLAVANKAALVNASTW